MFNACIGLILPSRKHLKYRIDYDTIIGAKKKSNRYPELAKERCLKPPEQVARSRVSICCGGNTLVMGTSIDRRLDSWGQITTATATLFRLLLPAKRHSPSACEICKGVGGYY